MSKTKKPTLQATVSEVLSEHTDVHSELFCGEGVEEERIVLMYKTKPTESYYNDQYMFVDLDGHSGNYPTRSKATSAYNFKTIEKAQQYDSRDEFFVVKLLIQATVTPTYF